MKGDIFIREKVLGERIIERLENIMKHLKKIEEIKRNRTDLKICVEKQLENDLEKKFPGITFTDEYKDIKNEKYREGKSFAKSIMRDYIKNLIKDIRLELGIFLIGEEGKEENKGMF